ncbi:MAG: hypothetical protein ACK5KT_14925 [Dysgonomonas sp.]
MSRSQNGEKKRRIFAKVISRLFFCFLSIALLIGCTQRDASLVSVTYEVSVNSDTSHNVFIAYRDSTGYVTLYAEKDWSIQVSLPRRSVASLLVISERDLDVDFNDRRCSYSLSTHRHVCVGRIIQGENLVSDSSDNLVSISMLTPAP